MHLGNGDVENTQTGDFSASSVQQVCNCAHTYIIYIFIYVQLGAQVCGQYPENIPENHRLKKSTSSLAEEKNTCRQKQKCTTVISSLHACEDWCS